MCCISYPLISWLSAYLLRGCSARTFCPIRTGSCTSICGSGLIPIAAYRNATTSKPATCNPGLFSSHGLIRPADGQQGGLNFMLPLLPYITFICYFSGILRWLSSRSKPIGRCLHTSNLQFTHFMAVIDISNTHPYCLQILPMWMLVCPQRHKILGQINSRFWVWRKLELAFLLTRTKLPQS